MCQQTRSRLHGDRILIKLLAPAHAVIARLSPPLGFALVALLFVLAQLVAPVNGALSLLSAPVANTVEAMLTLLSIYFVAALYVWVTAGTRAATRSLARIAAGDLGTRAGGADAARRASGDALQGAVDRMAIDLVDIVNQVRTSSESIASRARNIADDNTDLAQRTQEQSASLEETAAAMEQLGSTLKQNSDNCSRASDLAEGASGVAGQAAQQMEAVSLTMAEIDTSSRQVADILGTIDAIAFQTNILALNAAVEAARAGDQGRGFAVVAAEVRSLAQRTAEAAKEIGVLIRASNASVANGSRLVDAAGGTMGEVLSSVHEVSEVIGEIAMASAQQSAAVEEINGAVAQMDAITHQNASLVDEAAAAAVAFEQEAVRLVDVVGAFKIDHVEARDQAVDLVRRAVAHVGAVGLARALEDFNAPRGEFNDGRFYIYAGDFEGVTLANGGNPGLCGQNHYKGKSVDGRRFVAEIIDVARSKGQGWCDYLWKNPETRRTEVKSTYFEAVEGVFLSCGIYKGRKEGAVAEDGSARRTRVAPSAPGLRLAAR
ncbi:MAG TPA: methyl-accepting chemotaxis protein [Pseudomonadales bacterium]|nr:methyl-accepting chemotaxis protein [Pseudomonadales bacterium]